MGAEKALMLVDLEKRVMGCKAKKRQETGAAEMVCEGACLTLNKFSDFNSEQRDCFFSFCKLHGLSCLMYKQKE